MEVEYLGNKELLEGELVAFLLQGSEQRLHLALL